MTHTYTAKVPNPDRDGVPQIRYQALYTVDPMALFGAVMRDRQNQPWQNNAKYQAR